MAAAIMNLSHEDDASFPLNVKEHLRCVRYICHCCLTFSVGHTELWRPGPPAWPHIHLETRWPALKYLVLITATTFTLAGYRSNIIPAGAGRPRRGHRTVIQPQRGRRPFPEPGIFYQRNGTRPRPDSIGRL